MVAALTTRQPWAECCAIGLFVSDGRSLGPSYLAQQTQFLAGLSPYPGGKPGWSTKEKRTVEMRKLHEQGADPRFLCVPSMTPARPEEIYQVQG
jgi:hypothetical protein